MSNQKRPADSGTKPFRLNVSKEWCETMAKLEGAQDGPEPSVEHEWVKNDPRWPSIRDIEFCAICTVGRRADGKNKPCRGWTPAITLRAAPALPPHQDVEKLRWTVDGTWIALPDEGTTTGWKMNVADPIHAHELARVHNAAVEALARRAPADQGQRETLEQIARETTDRLIGPSGAKGGKNDADAIILAALQRARDGASQ